jgi:hypothetical protein
VTGLPANVQVAKGQIEEHILQRTGMRPAMYGANGMPVNAGADMDNNGMDKTYCEMNINNNNNNLQQAYAAADIYTGYALQLNNTVSEIA